jgi:gluconate 5-dehydrogenase
VGARVVVGRPRPRLQSADRSPRQHRKGVVADVTQEADAERIVKETLDAYGRLDIIINAVGGGAGKVLFDAEAYPRDAWDWIYELNVRSTLIATQAAVKAMIAGGRGGRVLNISSVRASLGINAGYSAYVAAKGAISSLTRHGPRMGEPRDHGEHHRPTFVGRPSHDILNTRRPRAASSAASRWLASARRRTSPARRSSSARTPRRS